MADINRREFLKSSLGGTTAASLLGAKRPLYEDRTLSLRDNLPHDAPNILILFSDQHRKDACSCYGNSILSSPHIDRIAQEGIRFDNYHSQNPVCMPSRATFLTGRYPTSHGVTNNGRHLPRHERTIAHILREYGYETGAIGKMHLHNHGSYGVSHHELLAEGAYEAGALWDAMETFDIPLPYYGFNHCEITIGHGNIKGHYRRYLNTIHDNPEEWLSGKYAVSKSKTGAPVWVSPCPVEHFPTTWTADQAVSFIRRNRNRPWMLWASFEDPHQPWNPPEEYARMFPAKDMEPLPRKEGELYDKPPDYIDFWKRYAWINTENGRQPMGDTQFREVIAANYALIKLMDDSIGKIMKELETLGILENTIVIYTTDHGEFLGEHGMLYKSPHYECILNIPHVWRLPASLRSKTDSTFSQGMVSDALVGHVDIVPTLLNLIGLPVPYGVQGKSMKGILEGKETSVREAIMADQCPIPNNDQALYQIRTLITDSWKLIHYHNEPFGVMYELEQGEYENLYNNPQYGKVRRRLEEQLLFEILENTDPLPRPLGFS